MASETMGTMRGAKKRTGIFLSAVMLALTLSAPAIHAEQASDAAAAAEAPKAGGDSTTGTGGPEDSRPPADNADQQKKTGPDEQAATKRASAPRNFIDLYYGYVTTENSSISSSTQGDCFLFCGPVQYFSGQAHYEPSSAFGVRYGAWFDKYPALGLALDIAYLSAESSNVRIWYVPIAVEPLVRYSMLATDAVPDGRLQLYGGVTLALVIGNVRVNGTGGSSAEFGFGGLLGAAWHFPSVAVFGEYRIFDTKLSFDSSNDWISFGQSKASASLNTRQLVFGVSFKH